MTRRKDTSKKLDRIEALLRVLALAVIVASSIASLGNLAATFTLAVAIAYLAWIVISSAGAQLGVARGTMREWWVMVVDAVFIASAILVGQSYPDELALVALIVPIGIMTLRGQLALSIVLALFSTYVSYLVCRQTLLDPREAFADKSVEVIAHTLAWGGIYGMVAMASRAGFKFLELSDLDESEGDRRLDMLLDRAPDILNASDHHVAVRRITEVAREIFQADSASIMEKSQQGMMLAGLSRKERYIEPAGNDEPAEEHSAVEEASHRVSIADFVAYNDQPILLNSDLANDPRFRNIVGRSEINSSMSVPVQVGESLYGVLNVTQLDESAPKFTSADLRVARVLAYISAIALGKHRG